MSMPESVRFDIAYRTTVRVPAKTWRLPPAILGIIQRAAEDWNVEVADVIGTGKKTAPVTKARRQACQELVRMGFGISQVARWVRIHHTSVMHYLKKERLNPKSIHVEAAFEWDEWI